VPRKTVGTADEDLEPVDPAGIQLGTAGKPHAQAQRGARTQ